MATFEKEHETLFTDDGEEIKIERSNTTLYTFFGELAMYDHVYIDGDRTDGVHERAHGYYFFNHDPVYESLRLFIEDNRFQQVLNGVAVPDCDRDAFSSVFMQSIERGMES